MLKIVIDLGDEKIAELGDGDVLNIFIEGVWLKFTYKDETLTVTNVSEEEQSMLKE